MIVIEGESGAERGEFRYPGEWDMNLKRAELDAKAAVIASGMGNRIEKQPAVRGDAGPAGYRHDDTRWAAYKNEQAARGNKSGDAAVRIVDVRVEFLGPGSA